MQQFKYSAHDFDVWATAVKQQMLESLAKRRHSAPTEVEPPEQLAADSRLHLNQNRDRSPRRNHN
ncbi:MAG: hypothetical protein ACFBSG_17310 [Leptolyngbyaceae cyanobacterium]